MNVTIGARVIKTGIAVALALFLAHMLDLRGAIIAGVAAVFAVQPSVYRSWQHMLEQVQANTLGALLALGVGMAMPVNEVIVGLTCIVVILITIAMRMEATVTLSLVTTIVVLDAGGEWMYALERFATILIGIGAAFLVNAVIMPPRPTKQFLTEYREALFILSLLIRTAVSDELKEREAKAERDKLNRLMNRLNERYAMMEEEWRKWRRFRPLPGRHLVVRKQMMRALTYGQLVLDAVQAHYFSQRKDRSADRTLDKLLEEMIHYHEYTLWKYEGKIKRREKLYEKVGDETDQLLRRTIEHVQNDDGKGLPLIIVASAVFEYGEQLRRLDKMVGNVTE